MALTISVIFPAITMTLLRINYLKIIMFEVVFRPYRFTFARPAQDIFYTDQFVRNGLLSSTAVRF